MLNDYQLREFDKQIDKKIGERKKLKGEIKMSMFRLLNKYKIGKQVYYILEDGLVLIIAKEKEVIKMKDNLYSLRYDSTDRYIPIEYFDKMFIYENKITILRKTKI